MIALDMTDVSSDYAAGMNTRQIAEAHGISQDTILRLMRAAGVELRNIGHRRIASSLSPYQTEVLNGELLGDGNLIIGKSYVNAKFQWGGRFLSHGELIQNAFGEFSGTIVADRIYWKFSSKAAAAFTDAYHLWYPHGKKIVPANLALTPATILHWYIGDGYLKQREKRRPAIKFSTQCFLPEHLSILQTKLAYIGFPSYLESNGNGYMIGIRTPYTAALLDYMGACPVAEYSYKWLSAR